MKNLFVSIAIVFSILFNLTSCQSDDYTVMPSAVEDKTVSVSTAEVAFPDTKTTSVEINGVRFQKSGDQFVYSSDILMSEEQIATVAQTVTRGAISTNLVKRWPDAVVYYTIAADFLSPERVKEAIAHWEANTNIRFVARTSSNANYVEFVNSTGNSSYIGMIGGRQPINLSKNATSGVVMHEIGHAVGLFHEHCRSDRDKYVTMRYENLDATKLYDFTTYLEDGYKGNDVGEFDFGSIMMYDSWAFSYTGIATMVKKDGTTFKSQRVALSAGDIEAVKAIYALEDTTTKTTTETTTTTAADTKTNGKGNNKNTTTTTTTTTTTKTNGNGKNK